MRDIQKATWADIEGLRTFVGGRPWGTVAEAAQAFARHFTETFSAVVLARVFLVLPLERLPPDEQAAATRVANGDLRFGPRSRTLSLLGTYGREDEWRDRHLSRGHLAIPLVDRAFVGAIPMIAKVLADLEADLSGLDDARGIASQRMLGGLNVKFFIEDAQSTKDSLQRLVVPAQDFVARHGVRTVFGMGGAYVDGTLAIVVVFTDQLVPAAIVDRFPSLISNFKMATAAHLSAGRLYPPSA